MLVFSELILSSLSVALAQAKSKTDSNVIQSSSLKGIPGEILLSDEENIEDWK